MDPLAVLSQFQLDRVLREEPEKCRLTLLGSLPASWQRFSSTYHADSHLELDTSPLRAIIRVEKTALDSETVRAMFNSIAPTITSAKLVAATDIYAWLMACVSSSEDKGDIKINVICPATDVHVRKYCVQQTILVCETPALYQSIVLPYINSIPPARTRWVDEILQGHAEQDKILFSSPDFVILPDMKWDLQTISSLYLVAITRNSGLRSLRDLRYTHVHLLQSIKQEAYQVVKRKWGIEPCGLRLYIHYQPSYYHFHVHIVNANLDVGLGMAVGQAHLLEDVISMLQLDTVDQEAGIFQRMTLSYGLGDQHALYTPMKAAQEIPKSNSSI